MGQIDFNTFKERLNNSNSNNQQQSQTQGSSRPYVGYFGLKNNGDQAIVRFMVDKPEDIFIMATHQLSNLEGKYKYRRANCLRDAHDPVSKCPLCEAGEKLEYKSYIPMIVYERDDEGKVVPVPKTWERSAMYVNTITNMINEYGPLSDSIFKITRNGEAGSTSTTYDVSYGLPTVYKSEIYPKVEGLFEGYSPLGPSVVDLNYDELSKTLEGIVPEKMLPRQWNGNSNSNQGSARTYSQPTAPSPSVASVEPRVEAAPQHQSSTPQTSYRPNPMGSAPTSDGMGRPNRRYYQ